jgi:hypothetical protein
MSCTITTEDFGLKKPKLGCRTPSGRSRGETSRWTNNNSNNNNNNNNNHSNNDNNNNMWQGIKQILDSPAKTWWSYSQRAVSGRDIKMDSILPPVLQQQNNVCETMYVRTCMRDHVCENMYARPCMRDNACETYPLRFTFMCFLLLTLSIVFFSLSECGKKKN